MNKSKRKSQARPLPKIVVILGPNASGKSELAVKLAKKFNGEIISADSRQVYRGLNIGAGKVSGKQVKNLYLYKGVIHHLIDVVSPLKVFTVERYKLLAKKALKSILRKKKIPMIVGGTGLYIDALIYDINFPKVPPNLGLRKKLEVKPTSELFNKLKRIDPDRAAHIDPYNRRRLIRAIEIVEMTGKPVPKLKKESPYRVLKIGVRLLPTEHKRKIEERLKKRMKEGMVEEVKRLKKHLSWQRLDDLGLEYRYVARHLQGELSQHEVEKVLQKEIWHYAKRQLTWFRRDKSIHWITNQKEAEELVSRFL